MTDCNATLNGMKCGKYGHPEGTLHRHKHEPAADRGCYAAWTDGFPEAKPHAEPEPAFTEEELEDAATAALAAAPVVLVPRDVAEAALDDWGKVPATVALDALGDVLVGPTVKETCPTCEGEKLVGEFGNVHKPRRLCPTCKGSGKAVVE